jgi:hypothetical protein
MNDDARNHEREHRGVLDLMSEEASEGHSLVETGTVNKQIGTRVSLIVRDKQQLLKTINKQKRIISVFVSRHSRQIWTFRGPPT